MDQLEEYTSLVGMSNIPRLGTQIRLEIYKNMRYYRKLQNERRVGVRGGVEESKFRLASAKVMFKLSRTLLKSSVF